MSMQKLITLGLVGILLGACNGGTSGLSQRDVDAIQATQDRYLKAALAGDWDTWATTLTEDAVFMPADVAPLKGRDAIVAYAKQFPKVSALSLPENEIAGAGGLAYARGTYTFTVADSGDTVTGARSDLFRKQPDGSWLFSGATFHPTTPPRDRAADEAAIRALTKEVETLVNRRDFAAYSKLFTDDGDVVINELERTTGQSAIRAAFEGGWQGQPAACRITLHNDSIRFVATDIALIENRGTFTGCKAFGPGRDTAVVVRRNGKWMIAALRIYQAAKK